MSHLLRLFVALAVVTLSACSSGGASQGTSASAQKGERLAPMTPEEELDALVRGISGCSIDSRGSVDAKCEGASALAQWKRGHQAWLEKDHRAEAAAVGARNVKDPSAPVRQAAWGLVALRLNDDPAMQSLLVDASRSEKESSVQASIASAATSAVEIPAVRDLLVALLTHESENVRRRAVVALVPSSGPPLAAARPSLLSALKSGSLDVRRSICLRLRVGDDAELLSSVGQLLDAPDTPAALVDGCEGGLVLAWSDAAVAEPSKAAYERSMQCLEKCPRDNEHIGLGLLAIRDVLSPKPTANKLPDFVDKPRIEKILVGIIKDDKGQPLLRVTAAMAFGDLQVAGEKSGVPWRELAELGAKLADPTDH